MSDKLEDIKRALETYETSRDGSYADRVLPAQLGGEVRYLVDRLEAAERYIAATMVSNHANRSPDPMEWANAIDALEKAHAAWMGAKVAT